MNDRVSDSLAAAVHWQWTIRRDGKPFASPNVRLGIVAAPPQLSTLLGRVAVDRGWVVEDLGRSDLEQTTIAPQWNVLVVFLNTVADTGLLTIARASRNPATRVLVISPDRDPRHVADALGVGADDYLIDPFDINEWTARVERLILLSDLHREHPDPGVVRLDEPSRSISCGSAQVWLSPREWEVLIDLMRAAPRADSLNQGHTAVGPASSRVSSSTIRRLRQKLSAHGIRELEIRNVYGRGYIAELRQEWSAGPC